MKLVGVSRTRKLDGDPMVRSLDGATDVDVLEVVDGATDEDVDVLEVVDGATDVDVVDVSVLEYRAHHKCGPTKAREAPASGDVSSSTGGVDSSNFRCASAIAASFASCVS